MAIRHVLIPGDLDPKAATHLQGVFDDAARRRPYDIYACCGRMRDVVLRMLTRGEDPSRADLAAALQEAGELPQAIRDYVATRYVRETKLRKAGPKAPVRSVIDETEILVFYMCALHDAREAHDADDTPKTRNVKTRAAMQTAKAFGCTTKTIRRIVAPSPLRKPPQK